MNFRYWLSTATMTWRPERRRHHGADQKRLQTVMSGRIIATAVNLPALLQEGRLRSFRLVRVDSGAKLVRFVRNRNLDLGRAPWVGDNVKTQVSPDSPGE